MPGFIVRVMPVEIIRTATGPGGDDLAPFFDWLAAFPKDFSIMEPPRILAAPARRFWDPGFLRKLLEIVLADDRPRSQHILGEQSGGSGVSLTRLSICLASRLAAANGREEESRQCTFRGGSALGRVTASQ
jgi:hypothetical protein